MSWVTRGGSAPAGPSLLQQQQRRGRGIAGGGGGAREDGGDEGLGLFSRYHRSASVAAGEESDGQNGQVHPGRISVGQPRLTRSGMEDLLSAADMGKHDYDWLLTPPGTPLVSTLEAIDQFHLPTSAAPRSNLSARSTSTTTTASRFAVHQQDQTKQPARPARSSSATRTSMASYSSSQLSSSSGRTSMLNTSTASVSSSCRPSTPGNSRSSSSSRTRPSAPASSRSSTPSKARPAASPATGSDKPRPFHGYRPSTPTQRSHVPATSNSSNRSSMTPALSRSSSRPSTPRRAPVQSPAPAPVRSPSVGRAATASSRTPGPGLSRPSSPGARIRPPPQPLVVLPDFPLHAPPSKVPERPASAGRARPGLSSAARSSSHSEAAPPASSNPRRQYSTSSPVVTRGSCRLPDNSPKRRLQSNGHESGPPVGSKPMLRESAVPKTIAKTAAAAAAADSTGFGRTISKKSLDMALRHMDIRQSIPGGVRGASLFPQSIRSMASSKAIVSTRISDDDPKAPVSINGTHPADQGRHSRDVATSYINGGGAGTCENGAAIDLIIGSHEGAVRVGGRASEPDIYESSRYDAILLQEDAMNMSWLHSADAKPDQSPVFDLIRFETLPEPFVLL